MNTRQTGISQKTASLGRKKNIHNFASDEKKKKNECVLQSPSFECKFSLGWIFIVSEVVNMFAYANKMAKIKVDRQRDAIQQDFPPAFKFLDYCSEANALLTTIQFCPS